MISCKNVFQIFCVMSAGLLFSPLATADLTDDPIDGPINGEENTGGDPDGKGARDQPGSDAAKPPKSTLDSGSKSGSKEDSGSKGRNNRDSKKDESSNKGKTEKKPDKKPKKKLKPGPDNSDEPVLFESEGLRGAKFDGIIELQKNVIVSQGDFRMDADEAKVLFNKKTEDVEKVVAKGNVKIFKVDPKTGQKIRARGNTITFNENKQTVTIVGNARFWRGKDLVRGKKIIYNLKTGWLNASKVEGVITPGEKKK